MLGLTLAFEPKEPGVMRRPPRDPARPLPSGALVGRILLLSALMVAGTWWLFQYQRGAGASLAEARTAAINLFVAIVLLYLFSCRSLCGRARTRLLANRWAVADVTLQLLAQAALTYLPALNSAFRTAPLDARAWLLVAALATAAWAVVAVDKRIRHRVAW